MRGSTVGGAHTAHVRPARFHARFPAGPIGPIAAQAKTTYSAWHATLSRMTVRELLAELQHLPPELEVLAFEAGFHDYCEREVDGYLMSWRSPPGRRSRGVEASSGMCWKRLSSVVHHEPESQGTSAVAENWGLRELLGWPLRERRTAATDLQRWPGGNDWAVLVRAAGLRTDRRGWPRAAVTTFLAQLVRTARSQG